MYLGFRFFLLFITSRIYLIFVFFRYDSDLVDMLERDIVQKGRFPKVSRLLSYVMYYTLYFQFSSNGFSKARYFFK
jgi:hypothetical protein